MSTAFDTAQALYDAAEPPEYAPSVIAPTDLLEQIVQTLDKEWGLDDSQEVHRLSDRQATVGLWIDGHEYSLTLNREED